jgi:hypothetical protein
MLLMTDEWTVKSGLLVGVLSSAAILYALALLNPTRFQWAGRAVAGLVFAAYLAYTISELFFSNHPVRLNEPRSTASPMNAVRGLIIIGLPALWYAARKRRQPDNDTTRDQSMVGEP